MQIPIMLPKTWHSHKKIVAVISDPLKMTPGMWYYTSQKDCYGLSDSLALRRADTLSLSLSYLFPCYFQASST